MEIVVPRSKFRRQVGWVLIVLAVVFLGLLARDLYVGKIDLSLGLPVIMSEYALEIVTLLICIVAPYISLLLFCPGQISVDPEAKTFSHVFSSLWIFGREYRFEDFRSVEVRSLDSKERKEYYLCIKGKEQTLSFTFPELKEATGAAAQLAKATGLRNKGYVGAQR